MPLARRRVPGLAPRDGSRIRTGGDALVASVLGVLAVALCSSIIAVLHGSLGADYQALGLVYLPAVIGVAFLFGLRAEVLDGGCRSRHLRRGAAAARRPRRRRTPASGCCSRRCCSRPPPWPSCHCASGGARSRPTSASARLRCWAGLSSALVGGASLELAQVDAARVGAAAIGAPAARIVLGRGPLAGQVALAAGRRRARDRAARADGRGSEAVMKDENALRVARSLAGVLALAQERERLAHADVEAEALRHSDALESALLPPSRTSCARR